MKSRCLSILFIMKLFFLILVLESCSITKQTSSYQHQHLAFNYLKEKKYDKALEEYDKAIEADPNDFLAYYNRGIYYSLYTDKKKQALEDLSKSIELKPDVKQVHVARGEVYMMDLGEFDKALKDFDKAIEIDPEFFLAYFKRSDVFVRKQQYDSALKNVEKGIQFCPSDQRNSGLCRRGIIFRLQRKYELALADFNSIINEQPNYRAAFCQRAILYFDLKEYDKAVKDFEKSIKLADELKGEPPDTEYYYLGLIYEKQNKPEKALESYKKSLTFDQGKLDREDRKKP